ncbi:MAG: hypothetical protein RIC56_15525 [Pseudomonadales bacterium]
MIVLAYVILLPAAVWLLGAVFNLLDHANRPATLARIAVRLLPFVGVALLFGDRATAPIVGALISVLTAHIGWSFLARALVRSGWRRDPGEV